MEERFRTDCCLGSGYVLHYNYLCNWNSYLGIVGLDSFCLGVEYCLLCSSRNESWILYCLGLGRCLWLGYCLDGPSFHVESFDRGDHDCLT